MMNRGLLFTLILTAATDDNLIKVEAAKNKLAACIKPYPGTTSDIAGRVVVTFDEETDDLTYFYKLVNIEGDTSAGTHIHSGTACNDATLVGGHYWDKGPNGTIPDQWTAEYGAVYSATSAGTAKGSFTINSGYGFEENMGHAVVVHAPDGSRIGCGVLARPGPGTTGACGATGFGPKKLQTCLAPYPGTDNDIEGKVIVTFDEETGNLTYKFRGVGLEESVEGLGTHIHSGTACDDATLVGGHYWDKGPNGTIPDPWTAEYGAVYSTNEDGDGSGLFTINSGYGFEENDLHAVVLHDSTGARVGCGVLGKGKTGQCIGPAKGKKLQACITAYPGTISTVSGKVVVRFDEDTDDLTYEYKFRDLEASVVAGTHIHSGTACDDATLVGGHYWDKGPNGTIPDPWTAEYGAVYSTNAGGNGKGSFTINSGYGFEENDLHAVVLHDSTGARVGCGVLGKGKTGPCA